MSAKDKIQQIAMLGRIFEEESKKQTSKVDKSELRKARIQLGGAVICILEAIDELEKIPGTGDWLMLFSLRMIAIELSHHEKELAKEN